MQLTINNLTGSTKTYLSGAVSIPATSSLAITSNTQQFSLSIDGQLRADIYSSFISISDGINTYGGGDAIDYLQKIPKYLNSLADNLGNSITSTANGSKQALDVNVAGSTVSTTPSELINGQLFTTSVQAVAATGGADNPLVLLRNPIANTKTLFIKKVMIGTEVVNVLTSSKIFGQPTLTNTVSTITNITQPGLSGTVTVTTSAANGATVGATVVITDTTNFNGTYTVAFVTSTTIYTFNRNAPLLTQTNNSGTSTMNSSLGTAMSIFPLKRVASPTPSIAIANSLPTVPSNGDFLIGGVGGQNNNSNILIDGTILSLEPGQNMLVTASPASNNRSMIVTIIWAEV